jgi:hypothetical protein
MKRNAAIYILLAIILVATSLWISSEETLENTLDDYEKAVQGGVPSDLKLTICYMDPTILTRVPVRTLEDLMGYSGTKTIGVGSGKLAAHADLLRKLDATCLQGIEEDTNAQPVTDCLSLVYILERGDGRVLLEVMATSLIHDDIILVNGFAVENKPIFYELIDSFLTDEDRSVLERTLK